MNKLIVKWKKHFSAHNALLRASDNYLFASESNERFCSDGHFVSLVMSALAIESLCNTVGDLIMQDWKDYESASPKAKIRIICHQLNIPHEKHKEPFSGLYWAISFRNKIVHAKPEPLSEEMHITRKEYEALMSSDGPQSGIEKRITIANAKRALQSIKQFENMVTEKLPEEIRYIGDGWEMNADPYLGS